MINSRTILAGQIARFGIVGLLAAGVHFSVVIFLVQMHVFAPLSANVFGFATGFQVSYWGHRLWTFGVDRSFSHTAFPKLLLVQLLNFAANQSLFYLFLSLHVPYVIALFIVLAMLPIFTFMASKRWVFAS